MIFIGYSSGDRYTVVESLVFHLKSYGFEVWYDFYDMFLGDNRYEENFKKGMTAADDIVRTENYGRAFSYSVGTF